MVFVICDIGVVSTIARSRWRRFASMDVQACSTRLKRCVLRIDPSPVSRCLEGYAISHFPFPLSPFPFRLSHPCAPIPGIRCDDPRNHPLRLDSSLDSCLDANSRADRRVKMSAGRLSALLEFEGTGVIPYTQSAAAILRVLKTRG